jgi:ComF family protein
VSFWRSAANALVSTLVAPPCAICARTLDDPLAGAVCAPCWAPIEQLTPQWFTISPRIRTASALGEYEGLLREIIHALKYDGRRSVGAGLSRIMGRQAADLLDGAQFVVPVPLHRSRQRERGFNQSEILARDFEVPVCRSLRRTRATQPQVDLTAHERYLNVADAFTMSSRAAAELSGKVVVLVDDVTTTGATLDACAQVLLAAGVGEVRAITAARVATGPR